MSESKYTITTWRIFFQKDYGPIYVGEIHDMEHMRKYHDWVNEIPRAKMKVYARSEIYDQENSKDGEITWHDLGVNNDEANGLLNQRVRLIYLTSAEMAYHPKDIMLMKEMGALR